MQPLLDCAPPAYMAGATRLHIAGPTGLLGPVTALVRTRAGTGPSRTRAITGPCTGPSKGTRAITGPCTGPSKGTRAVTGPSNGPGSSTRAV